MSTLGNSTTYNDSDSYESEFYSEAESVADAGRDDIGGTEGESKEKPWRRYKKNSGSKAFIIDEAEVDDEVEDEEEWEDGAEEIEIVDEHIVHGLTPYEIEGKRRGLSLWNSPKEEELEEYIYRKYGSFSESSKQSSLDSVSEDITQQTLLPGIKDPNLWIVKCHSGEEKATTLHLMRKFIAFQDTEDPLQIKSVIASYGINGYIYIEAFKQQNVKHAIQNISSLRMGQWDQKMVPITEMTDVLKVFKRKPILSARQFVRLRTGLYRDDIAQIVNIDEAENSVYLKLLPRIDYMKLRGVIKNTHNGASKNKRKCRPAVKPFDCEAVRAIGGEVMTNGNYFIFEGSQYRDGFLYKKFSVNAIISDGVKPSLTELEWFTKMSNDFTVTLSSDSLKSHNLSPDDNVEVCEGELKTLKGKVISVNGNMVIVMPKYDKLMEPIQFQANELRKYFQVGDHVKVINGNYEGETGLIVRQEESRVILISDLTMHEIEVLPKDVQLCSNTATGLDSLGKYEWGDFVHLDGQTVGVIVRIEKEIFHILNMFGKVIKMKPQAINKRRESKNAVALDSEKNGIKVKDIVKVIEGPHKNLRGPIKHLYRSFVFIHAYTYAENGGYFVSKSKHLQLFGSVNNDNVMLSGYSSPKNISKEGFERNSFMGAKRVRDIIGKTIKVVAGAYKGSVGTVKDVTHNSVLLELHSGCQSICISKMHIAPVQSVSRASCFAPTYHISPLSDSFEGSRTPIHGCQTPLHETQTPMYESGSQTPHYSNVNSPYDTSYPSTSCIAWDPAIPNTPAPNFSEISQNVPTPVASSPYTSDYGSVYGMNAPYSPYNAAMSPQVNQHNISFGFLGAVSPSAFTHGATGNISCESPSTSEFSPFTATESPSSYYFSASETNTDDYSNHDWITSDVEVSITDSYDDQALWNKQAVIQTHTLGMCSLLLKEEGRMVSVSPEHLKPVCPEPGDDAKIILGEDREAVGKLLSVDNQEGVLKFENGEIKLIQMRYMCRLRKNN